MTPRQGGWEQLEHLPESLALSGCVCVSGTPHILGRTGRGYPSHHFSYHSLATNAGGRWVSEPITRIDRQRMSAFEMDPYLVVLCGYEWMFSNMQDKVSLQAYNTITEEWVDWGGFQLFNKQLSQYTAICPLSPGLILFATRFDAICLVHVQPPEYCD
ncbi:hypothetical protein KIPB_006021 [Kipferlia bialata]|uniref:Kelch-type beta propeller n=1 Tax=Kipferlia bialata TaxID=797122 RepID=A0A391NWI1_9EUKA|nr:hypothetical protein KIPB_006021 [Kipferlia bialata]|eukprot:g6021.t1